MRFAIGAALVMGAACTPNGPGTKGPEPRAEATLESPVLATVRGSLLGQSGGDVRMAIAWLPASVMEVLPVVAAAPGAAPRDGGYSVFPRWEDFSSLCAQAPSTSQQTSTYSFQTRLGTTLLGGAIDDVAAQAVSPTQFEISLTTLPPQSSLVSLPIGQYPQRGTGKIALGIVLAYDDLDHNRKLDRGTVSQPGDRVLAASYVENPTYIVYLDGQLGGGGFPLPAGFSQFTLLGGLTAKSAPLTDPMTLRVGAGNEFWSVDVFGCTEYLQHRTFNQAQPAGAEVFCAANKRNHSWRGRTATGCVGSLSEGVVCLATGSAPPVGWPCP